MTDNLISGAGQLFFDGEPKLSVGARVLLDRVNLYDRTSPASGFFAQDGLFLMLGEDVLVDALCEEVRARAQHPDLAEAEFRKQGYPDGMFAYLERIGLRIAGSLREVFVSDETSLDGLLDAIVNDPDSNLLGYSYEEASWPAVCGITHRNEFAGMGIYSTRDVLVVSDSARPAEVGKPLQAAIRAHDDQAAVDVLAREVARLVNTVRSAEVRERLVKRLLSGDVLETIKKQTLQDEHAELDGSSPAP